jgi:hypothetical protein
MTAPISQRLFVVIPGTHPLNSLRRFPKTKTHAHPPAPGFGTHAPSVYMTTSGFSAPSIGPQQLHQQHASGKYHLRAAQAQRRQRRPPSFLKPALAGCIVGPQHLLRHSQPPRSQAHENIHISGYQPRVLLYLSLFFCQQVDIHGCPIKKA